MSLLGKMGKRSSGGEDGRKMSCLQQQINEVVEREDLMKETDFLKKNIEHELLCAKKNSKRNRRANMEEEDIEDDLEYLRRWANKS